MTEYSEWGVVYVRYLEKSLKSKVNNSPKESNNSYRICTLSWHEANNANWRYLIHLTVLVAGKLLQHVSRNNLKLVVVYDRRLIPKAML